MPHLNLNFNVLIYEDYSEKNPRVRLPDLGKDINGIQVSYDKSDRIVINPSEIKNIAVTTRSVLWDSTTQLAFQRPVDGDDRLRIQWNGSGTNPAFRTLRSLSGDATTVVSISRVSPYVARIQVQSGTAWTTTSIQTGDLIRFERSTDAIVSPFSVTNVGQTWTVQAKGTDYIDYIDNGQSSLDTNITLGADFAYVLRLITTGPVKINDTIQVEGADINPSNTGKFTITDVSSDFIEIISPFGVPQTVTYSPTALFTIYEYLIGFVLARGIGGPFKVRFGNQTEWALVDRIGDTALLLTSISTYQIQATNDGTDPVEISIQYCKVIS